MSEAKGRPQLRRLVLTFKPEGVEIRTLYRSKDGGRPNTKARAREVLERARAGLRGALEAFGGRVDVTGTSGYEVREDTISVDATQRKG